MKGGKIVGTLLILLPISLAVVMIILFLEKNPGFMALIILLLALGTFIWLAYKFYKPGFTEIIFSGTDITSKTYSESEVLELDDIKGIWFLKHPHQDAIAEIYNPNKRPPKNSLIIIGDIQYFDGAQYFGLDSATTLHDSFSYGYTSIHYRKELDEILDYYFYKINERNS